MVIATDLLITSYDTHSTSATELNLQNLSRLINIYSFLGFICLHYFKLLEIIKDNPSSSIPSWPFWMRTAIKENTAAFQIFMTMSGWLFFQQLAGFLMIPLSVLFFQTHLLSGQYYLPRTYILSQYNMPPFKNWIKLYGKFY